MRTARTQTRSAELAALQTPALGGMLDWTRALRVHQWSKNILVLLPLLLAHKLGDFTALSHALIALAAFCACASSAYIVNDLLDIPSDRAHPSKRRRPFASGALSARAGAGVAAALAIAAALLAAQLPWAFSLALAVYLATSIGYSVHLKRMPIVDVLVLAGLYTMRIIAGGAAAAIFPSFWLLAFSMFLFLSLAIAKRVAEVHLLQPAEHETLRGRGYLSRDLYLLVALGAAGGYTAVLVLALYINSPDAVVLYRHPHGLWAIMPVVLFWISRVWMLTTRGSMHEDPIVFAFRDRASLACAAAIAVVGVLSV